MARTSPSALMDHLLPKLTELCRGRQGLYQQVEDRENNNYSYNNNNYTENDREVGVFRSGPGLKVWQMITKNIMGINCLYSQVQRKSGFLPISSEVDLAEVGVVRVALVSMGEHIGLLDNWYTLPEEGNNKVPLNSILFPISTYLINVLKKIKLDMTEIGSWWFSLEMRKLRLRQNIKALYLYDIMTQEQMLLYKRGTVTIQDEYILTTTIDSRIEVWIL